MLRWIHFHNQSKSTIFSLTVPCVISLLFLPRATAFGVIIFLFLFYAFLVLFANYRLRGQALRCLNDHCDPEPLLELSLEELQKRPAPQVLSHINAGVSLYALGRFQEALEHLDPGILPKSPDSYVAALIWLDRSAVMYDLKEAEEMAHCLSLAEKLLSSPQVPRSQRSAMTSILHQNRLAYRLLTEEYSPDVESGFQELLSQAKTKFQRVSCHSALAGCALARGDKTAAREHLEYVAAHGNKLYARTQALELLGSLF